MRRIANRQAAIDRFYDSLDRNVQNQNRFIPQLRLLLTHLKYSEPSLNKPGLYFMFEPGEYRQSGGRPRVTRVGRDFKRLWTWFMKHYHDSNRSISLSHVFKAATERAHRNAQLTNAQHTVFMRYWNDNWEDIPEPPYVAMRDFELNTVLPHVHACSFTWVPIRDQPKDDESDQEDWKKGQIALVQDWENLCIALLSNCQQNHPVVDGPSSSWLGRDSRQPLIRASGLWNVAHVNDPWSDHWLNGFDNWCK